MNIKKIIKEEIDNFDWVNEIETPLSWLLDNFGDLTPVAKGDKIIYVDGDGKILFYYYQDKKNGYCFINDNKIWSVLMTRFGINYGEIQKVITIWLDEVYGLVGLTPHNK